MDCRTRRYASVDYSGAHQPYAIPDLLVMRQGWLARILAWAVEARSHRVLCLLAGLWVINVFDLMLTLIAARQGLLHESNPVAAFILTRGPQAVCFYKCVLVAGGSVILIRYRRRLLAEFTAAAMLTVYALVAVRWKWCYELYELANTGGVSSNELQDVGTWASEIPTF
ncbi:MAG: hypothetical protein GY842_27675 [bacterium]|nr:hypothetical protein [bacterium]